MRSFEIGVDGSARTFATPQAEAVLVEPMSAEKPILEYMYLDRQRRMQLFQKVFCIQRPELILHNPDNENKEKNL